MDQKHNEEILLLEKCISIIRDNETDAYKLLIINRILSSFSAVNLLIDNDFGLEAPVVLRVVLEHLVRLMYVHQTPNYIEEKPDVYKMFGKGVRPTVAIKKLAPQLSVLYEFLSAFTHPDMLSLTVEKEMSKSVSEFMRRLIYAFVIITLVEMYPTLGELVDPNEHLMYLLTALEDVKEMFVQESTDEVLERAKTFDMNQISASEDANQLIGELLHAINEGQTPEQIINEMTKEILEGVNKTK